MPPLAALGSELEGGYIGASYIVPLQRKVTESWSDRMAPSHFNGVHSTARSRIFSPPMRRKARPLESENTRKKLSQKKDEKRSQFYGATLLDGLSRPPQYQCHACDKKCLLGTLMNDKRKSKLSIILFLINKRSIHVRSQGLEISTLIGEK